MFTKDKPLFVEMRGRMIANDALYDLHGVIRRNTPADCTTPRNDLMGQVLTVAADALKSSHVYDATFPNGERVVFAGSLPQFTTYEAVYATCVKPGVGF